MSVRQRVTAIQSKITSLTHSQFISMKQTNTTEQSNQTAQLKKKIIDQDQQIFYLRNLATRSYISEQDKQKYTIKVSDQRESNISTSPNKNVRNSLNMNFSNINSGNIKTSTLTKLLGHQILFKNQYEDGTPIPTMVEFNQMKLDYQSLKRKSETYDQQITHLRVGIQKTNQKNKFLYEQGQIWKKKCDQAINQLQKLKLNSQFQYNQLQKLSQIKFNYLNEQYDIQNKQNKKLQNIVNQLKNEGIQNKKIKLKMSQQIQNLKKQLEFISIRYQTEISNKKTDFSQKTTSKMKFEQNFKTLIEQKDIKLEEFLCQNLTMFSTIQSNQHKISQLQKLVSDINKAISQKDLNLQQTNRQLYNLAYRVEELQQEGKKKDLRIKKLQQNFSLEAQEKRSQIAGIKKQKRKLQLKIQSLIQEYENKVIKKDKKYKKLQGKLIGLQEQNKILLKKSSDISKSLSLNRQIIINAKKGQITEEISIISSGEQSFSQKNQSFY